MRAQAVDAIHALNRLAGVSESNVLRGCSFNRRAMAGLGLFVAIWPPKAIELFVEARNSLLENKVPGTR